MPPQAELNYEIEQEIKEALIDRVACGATLMPGETSISAASQNAAASAVVRRDERDQHGLKATVESDEVAEDVEFMASYREARLGQLKYTNNHPIYGELRECDPFEFTEEVDNADPRVFVVVHM